MKNKKMTPNTGFLIVHADDRGYQSEHGVNASTVQQAGTFIGGHVIRVPEDWPREHKFQKESRVYFLFPEATQVEDNIYLINHELIKAYDNEESTNG